MFCTAGGLLPSWSRHGGRERSPPSAPRVPAGTRVSLPLDLHTRLALANQFALPVPGTGTGSPGTELEGAGDLERAEQIHHLKLT